MALFYFDVLQDGDLEVDHVGTECLDMTHAQIEAQRCAVEIAMDRRSSQFELKIVVADHQYRQVLWLTVNIASGKVSTPQLR